MLEIISIVCEYIARVVACIFIADFLSGFFHWLADAYARPNWPIIGRLVAQGNILHQYNPRHLTRHSWLVGARVAMVIVAIALAVAYAIGQLNWMTWLVAFIGVNPNEIHKWAHRTKAENGRVITWLQGTGILLSPRHHAKHHREYTHYCAVTNYLNPLLDGVRFWPVLEWLVYRVTGVRRRVDLSFSGKPQASALPTCTLRSCQRRGADGNALTGFSFNKR